MQIGAAFRQRTCCGQLFQMRRGGSENSHASGRTSNACGSSDRCASDSSLLLTPYLSGSAGASGSERPVAVSTSLVARQCSHPAGRRFHSVVRAINRGLGKLYKAQGKFDAAAVFLRRAVTEDPQDPAAHYALAITLQRLHRDAEAKKELELFSAAKEERRFVRALEIASDPVAAREK